MRIRWEGKGVKVAYLAVIENIASASGLLRAARGHATLCPPYVR